jgi:hypothetical protein
LKVFIKSSIKNNRKKICRTAIGDNNLDKHDQSISWSDEKIVERAKDKTDMKFLAKEN